MVPYGVFFGIKYCAKYFINKMQPYPLVLLCLHVIPVSTEGVCDVLVHLMFGGLPCWIPLKCVSVEVRCGQATRERERDA